ncbi:hypothetical protein KKG48_01200 [Patescibacteria group bacterium]|nr:hypothetical protein [Patescibacteria group bacterium]MCG2695297.1 hypothetical protein [Candidatus Parcubacteria bacterium]
MLINFKFFVWLEGIAPQLLSFLLRFARKNLSTAGRGSAIFFRYATENMPPPFDPLQKAK